MISLKQHMDDWDDVNARARLMMDAYLGSLEGLAAAVGAMAASEGQQFLRELRGILAYLRAEPGPATIKRSRVDLQRAIHTLVEVLNERELEYIQMMRIMADAAATMAQTGTEHGEELRQVAGRVEAISRLDSIVEVRREIVERVGEMRAMAARVQQEGVVKARALEEELAAAREKLRAAAALAETDALTGLGNRRRAESAVEQAIVAGEQFSVLLLDLDGFKGVNDAYGHAQGDQLLKSIARSVKHCLKQSDLVCRWGGDEFVVILHGISLTLARTAGERIRHDAFGEFVLAGPEGDLKIQVGASIGAAEHNGEETAEELLVRVDQLMYEDKARLKRSGAARPGARG